MAKLNKAEAARATGKHRQTIKNWIKEGRLSVEISPEGWEVVDSAELQRAFGPLKSDGAPRPKKTSNRQLLDEITSLKNRIEVMSVEISSSKREHNLKDEIVSAKDKHINELQEEKRLLLAERLTPQAAAKKGWWIFGKQAA